MRAGDNWHELEKVIARYEEEGDEDKLEAAYYIIENIPYHSYQYSKNVEDAKVWFRLLREKMDEDMTAIKDSIQNALGTNAAMSIKWDVQVLDSAYLCENIDMAFKVRREQPWGKNVDFEIFCKYILPYRIADEVPMNWRREYYEKYNPLLDDFRNSGQYDTEDPVEALKYLMARLPLIHNPKYAPQSIFPFPHIGPEYVRYLTGSCREYTDFMIYVSRALGIPAAFNQSFNMHRVNAGHCWANFWNKYGEEFIISNYPPVLIPNRQDYTRATGKNKVYRETYHLNDRLFERAQDAKEPLNQYFSLPTYEDVTAFYTNHYMETAVFDSDCLQVHISNGVPVYLCSSCRTDWLPEDFAVMSNDKLVFRHIQKGEVLCLCIRNGNMMQAVSDPFVIDINTNRLRFFEGNGNRTGVRIVSKFSVTDEEKMFRERMINSIVEGSATECFDNPDTLLIIQAAPDRKYTEAVPYLQSDNEYEFLRFKSRPGTYCDAAEIAFYDMGKRQIMPVSCFGTAGTDSEHGCSNLYDGSTLTSFSSYSAEGGWSAVRLESPAKVSSIIYTPRNRDNFINEGDIYELFYFDKEWHSLGRREADSDELVYDDVPEGHLLLLKNHSGGVQERIFIHENGKQIWL